MAGIRDLDSGKIYIGQEIPKLDRAVDTLNGDKPYDGTLQLQVQRLLVDTQQMQQGCSM